MCSQPLADVPHGLAGHRLRRDVRPAPGPLLALARMRPPIMTAAPVIRVDRAEPVAALPPPGTRLLPPFRYTLYSTCSSPPVSRLRHRQPPLTAGRAWTRITVFVPAHFAGAGPGGRAHARRSLHRRARRVRTGVDVLDESRAFGVPAEKLPCHGAGRREVHAEEGADPPEMALDVIGGDRCHGEAEGAADGLRDVAGGYAVFRDGVQAGAGRGLRESQGDEARGIGPMHGGPPVGPVSRVAGDALFAGHSGDDRDEPVVAGAVH